MTTAPEPQLPEWHTTPEGVASHRQALDQIAKLADWLVEHTGEPKSSYGAVDAAINAMTEQAAEVDRLRADLVDTTEHLTGAMRVVRDEAEQLRAERDTLAAKLAAGEASDGYHTHTELYEYRMLYNAHAAMGWLADGFHVVKSWYHSDGEPCFGGGWFVVVAELSTGQVSNHYREEHWGLFNIPEELPPAFDGHTPADAADRLRAALGETGGTER